MKAYIIFLRFLGIIISQWYRQIYHGDIVYIIQAKVHAYILLIMTLFEVLIKFEIEKLK